MATLTKGRTFVSGETVTPAKLNELVDSATVTAIQTADIADGQITNAKVNASAAIAYSKLNLSNSIVAGDVTSKAITSDKVDDGAVVQVVQGTYATWSGSVSVIIPADDTIPLVSEGFQILSQAITPKSATNKVLVALNIPCATANYGGIAAIFRGSTCIGAGLLGMGTSAAVVGAMSVSILDSPASASSVTYSVRVGATQSPYQIYINGTTSGRLLGGSAVSTITLTEIKAS